MKMIMAVDENFAIGKDNDLLFRIKKDLRHFKSLTENNIIIMGRKTFDSMEKPLSNRENIVLTRNKDFKKDGVKVFNDIDLLLAYIYKSDKNIYVVGGGKIIDLLIDYCDGAILTKIHAKKDADTFMRNLDLDENRVIEKESELMEENGIKFSYVEYKNTNPIKELFVSDKCPDSKAIMNAINKNPDKFEKEKFKLINITENMANLKKFLRYRDSLKDYNDARENYYVGIPSIVINLGEKVEFDMEKYI
ncbi:MAG: dihydrofolate reductase [Tissierellia bacterium]|nr:dihydrofolate reductase [Tissierellia bacterium]